MNEVDNAILSVDNLRISFKGRDSDTVAVDGISFQLGRGETLAIVGESGSGKSVSSLAIMHLLPTPPAEISAGSITYSAKAVPKIDLATLSEKKIVQYRGAKIAMIFQEPMSALNPSQRCGAQVAEMLQIHTDLDQVAIKKKVAEMFVKVDLPEPERIYKAYPHQLSGGQLQRIMIAMALICEPDILIADEPTTALDVTVQETIVHLLSKVKTDMGVSTIFITHDLGLVRQIADRVVVMLQGQIVEQGTTEQIFEAPVHPYTRGLLACRPPLDVRLDRLPTTADFLQRDVTIAEVRSPLIQSAAAYEARLAAVAARPVLLSATHITKHYTSKKDFWGRPTKVVKAVNDVSFELRQGETLGLVGESGCGKSTLAKVLMQLIPATSGSVTFDGRELGTLSRGDMRALRADYQIIFQDPYSSLNPRMRVGAAIAEPMQVHGIGGSKGERTQLVVDILQKVGLTADDYKKYPHQFSGGQRQRICIARALGLKPKFILCDESVSALDVSVQAQVLNLLKDLREEYDLSYLFISHDLSVVKFISDHIMVMKEGQIVERGGADQIIENPQHVYTQRLISSIPK